MQSIEKAGAGLIKTSLSMSENCKKNEGKFITLIVYYVNYLKFPSAIFYSRKIANVV
jgi:hypothetical protein